MRNSLSIFTYLSNTLTTMKMKTHLPKALFVPFFSLLCVYSCSFPDPIQKEKLEIADAMEKSLTTELLDKWYPMDVDNEDGGFLSSLTYDFKPGENQDKMIVTQARHVWTNAKAFQRYPEKAYYKTGAEHGFKFLRDKMWDKEMGGFYQLVDKQGNPKTMDKTAYGNAFGIYGLAAYYMATKDEEGLELAKKAFYWLEEHSHDPDKLGYFQHLERDGTPVVRPDTIASTSDLGYKDQNSSIHLLEAMTELYQVWPDPLVKERLAELLYLIRDTITNPKGYLVLFLTPDWQPVSFKDSTEEVILRHHNLDHVSFGHDVETAFLMLEAEHVLGEHDDPKTMAMAKTMVDHALSIGWDNEVGGFYDEGYYFKDGFRIIRDTKNWWAQAEGLNALLMMSQLFPEDEHQYYEKFKLLWSYVDTYLIDHENGGWYSGGLDKQPDMKPRGKGNIWKSAYHNFRGMSNSVDMLRGRNLLESTQH
ncbi:Mannobiose 2-epimerase [Imperialibacter sp. EC-SDR9]|nr:N-acylglucosamine 2-epimerase [Imperialibacter sp. 75]CAD5248449.1 N-acylglucosamine 2-epimerase [Imperialibacter sp. 89]VVS97673.1 Mannobiose 2-epimerase [Imperialibacter sp. EC-SDR9]